MIKEVLTVIINEFVPLNFKVRTGRKVVIYILRRIYVIIRIKSTMYLTVEHEVSKTNVVIDSVKGLNLSNITDIGTIIMRVTDGSSNEMEYTTGYVKTSANSINRQQLTTIVRTVITKYLKDIPEIVVGAKNLILNIIGTKCICYCDDARAPEECRSIMV